ncbi:hypothetical protein [Virgibacillus salexigens]|uniref:Prophage pi2 protein 38 n=1 Tax=Virgibacillus kapii TaxID=1638645 RepID=A0ABQ2DLD6_9BACI|nr:hypothetical protein [Virgibacillus kapii]GGJ62004.1 hypothetical protein GCM10007111_25140 [Virgibacillus kapii]
MKLGELVTILEAIGLPVAYSHFIADENNPPPEPPFITYLTPGTDNFHADNKTYVKITNADIELYTNKKDLQVEKVLEDLFEQHEIAWNVANESYIESEQLFQRIYELGVI